MIETDTSTYKVNAIEKANTPSAYLMECRLKKRFRGYNVADPVTIDIKLEGMSRKKLTDLTAQLDNNDFLGAINSLGMIYRVCTCGYVERKNYCRFLKQDCGCCVFCSKDCKYLKR